ncbi:MAG: hypothetical protein GY822_25330 [Deltaproteobacteria bacterium]|nr:hypothetical protein [Deltaproteobacteria bacterium]
MIVQHENKLQMRSLEEIAEELTSSLSLLSSSWTFFALSSLMAALFLINGCGQVRTEGDFGGLVFSPSELAFAVHDRHTFADENGRITAYRKPANELAVDLYFASATQSAEQDWRFLSTKESRDLRRDLAMGDALVIRHLPLNQVLSERTLEWTATTALTDDASLLADGNAVDSDVEFYMSHAAENLPEDIGDTFGRSLGLGSRVDVKLNIDESEIDPSAGFINGSLELKRSRGDEQEGDVATGEVVLHFQIPVAPERVAKSNAGILAPIVKCAAAFGPSAQNGCDRAPSEALVDENTTF